MKVPINPYDWYPYTALDEHLLRISHRKAINLKQQGPWLNLVFQFGILLLTMGKWLIKVSSKSQFDIQTPHFSKG